MHTHHRRLTILEAAVPEPDGPPRGEKFLRRRDELARAALMALCDRGYAQTSLRDIAEHAGVTTGLLHYYFADREELILRCIELYRTERTDRMQALDTMAKHAGPDDNPLAVASQPLRVSPQWSRFYYDIRTQSMFEPYLQEHVADMERERVRLVWAVVSRHVELKGGAIPLDQHTLYSVIDGLFEKALRAQFDGDATAIDALPQHIEHLLDRITA